MSRWEKQLQQFATRGRSARREGKPITDNPVSAVPTSGAQRRRWEAWRSGWAQEDLALAGKVSRPALVQFVHPSAWKR